VRVGVSSSSSTLARLERAVEEDSFLRIITEELTRSEKRERGDGRRIESCKERCSCRTSLKKRQDLVVSLRMGDEAVEKERTENELRQSLITPSSVDEKELLEESELRDGDVRRSSSLETLYNRTNWISSLLGRGRRSQEKTNLDSRDSNSNMSSLDHRHVVRSISDGEKDRGSVVFDELDDESLLKRRDSALKRKTRRQNHPASNRVVRALTAHYSLAHQSEFQEDLR